MVKAVPTSAPCKGCCWCEKQTQNQTCPQQEDPKLKLKATHREDSKNISLQTEGYLKLLRNEIDEFRLLYVDWVGRFDPWDDTIDR